MGRLDDACLKWCTGLTHLDLSNNPDLAMLPDGTVLCLYESGRGSQAPGTRPWPYAYITLARFNLDWLTAPSFSP